MSKNYLNRRNVGHDPLGDPLLGGDPGFSRTRRMYDPVASVIGGITSAIGGIAGASASKSAASTQSNAALQAAAAQQQVAAEQIRNMQRLREDQMRDLQGLLNASSIEGQTNRQDTLNYLNNLRQSQQNLLAQNYATNVGQQAGIYNTSMGNLQPYMQTGAQGATTLASMIPQLTRSFTAADLKSNLAPNYEFMKQQGLGALAQSMNVAGGGSNMTRAATKFAEDYASNAYQNAFNNWQAQQNNIYNRLAGISGIGTTATQQGVAAGGQYGANLAGLGSNYGQQTNALNLGFGSTAAQTGLGYDQLLGQQRLGFGGQMAQLTQGMGANIANLATGGAGAAAAGMTGSAAAQAAGQIGATNALTGGLGNAANMYLLSSLIKPSGGGWSDAQAANFMNNNVLPA